MQEFQLIGTETLVEGRAFRVRRDHLRTPQGSDTKLEIVEHGGSVVMIPVDADGSIIFVRQYRHAAAATLLELPAGTRKGDEEYEVCAARELREETGMAAGRLQEIGGFFLAPGYSTEYMVAFLAWDLYEDPLPADDDEFLQAERIPIAEAYRMAENGRLPDAKSLAALMMSRSHLGEHL